MKKLESIAECKETADKSWIGQLQFEQWITASEENVSTKLGEEEKKIVKTKLAPNTAWIGDYNLMKKLVTQPQEVCLMKPNQNFGPDAVGFQKFEKDKMTVDKDDQETDSHSESIATISFVWVSVKLVNDLHLARETRISNSQVNPNHVYYQKRNKARPEPNKSMKNARKCYDHFICPHLDSEKMLLINVVLPKASPVCIKKDDLEPDQFLVNISCDNLHVLLKDEAYTKTIREYHEYSVKELTADVKTITNKKSENVSTDEDEEDTICRPTKKRHTINGNLDYKYVKLQKEFED